MDSDLQAEATVTAPHFVYRACVVYIVDGDTIDVDVDLGWGVWLRKQRLRLYGINTPEVRGPERPQGLESKAFVEDAVGGFASKVLIQTFKDAKGKYGRWLADVYYIPKENPDGPMISLNRTLLARGLAKEASY